MTALRHLTAERIATHLRNNKVLEEAFVWIFNSRTSERNAMRVLEQDMINAVKAELGPDVALANQRNEIAEKFWDQMGVCKF
ncbi:MAG: hypothetical protein ACLQSR_01400 [Limisphaerales bacterium]